MLTILKILEDTGRYLRMPDGGVLGVHEFVCNVVLIVPLARNHFIENAEKIIYGPKERSRERVKGFSPLHNLQTKEKRKGLTGYSVARPISSSIQIEGNLNAFKAISPKALCHLMQHAHVCALRENKYYNIILD